jgi:hypothetical protein
MEIMGCSSYTNKHRALKFCMHPVHEVKRRTPAASFNALPLGSLAQLLRLLMQKRRAPKSAFRGQ